MITEDYVNFKIAKLLEKKGFDWDCQYCYIDEDDSDMEQLEVPTGYDAEIAAPTLQMAMKWLREKKGIAVLPILSSILDNEKFLWDVKIVVAKTAESYSQGWIYESYERACEAGIFYCLENLV